LQASEDDRPSMDLFKSIFTDSSASEFSENEASEEEMQKTNMQEEVVETSAHTNQRLESSQPKQANDKPPKQATEIKQLAQVTEEPKLSWMGVQQAVKTPDKVIFTPSAKKTQHKQPSITATTSNHYGPALPTTMKGS